MESGEKQPAEARRHRVHTAVLTVVVLGALMGLTHAAVRGQNELSPLLGVEALALHGALSLDWSPKTHAIIEENGVCRHELADMAEARRSVTDGHAALAGAWSVYYAVLGTRFTWDLMEMVQHPAIRLLQPLRGS